MENERQKIEIWFDSYEEIRDKAKRYDELMSVPDDVREFIGEAMYDAHGQLIFRGADKDNLQQFLDVRGWGAIQNMGFKTPEEAMAFQDRVGQWVTDVINEKLNQKS